MRNGRGYRKKFSIILSAILVFSLLTACGSDKESSAGSKATPTPTKAASSGDSGDSEKGSEADIPADGDEDTTASSTGVSTTDAAEGSVAEGSEEAVEDAKPTPTPKPANNDKPTPTPKQAHVHSYTVTSSTPGQDCRHSGVDTYTCSCGDSYTQDNGKYGDHVWVTDTSYTTEIIHHDAEYKTETVWVCDCGLTWGSQSEAQAHYQGGGCGGYHSSTKKTVTREAWDEEIQTPYTRTYCAVCGTE